MKHYEKRLEHDEQTIRDKTAAVAALVREALKNSVHAVLTGNNKLANLTVLGDGEINRAVRAVDRDCQLFIVRHLPSAGHLRLMSATIRAAVALERIGDYAVSISRVATRLSEPPSQHLATTVENMARDSGEMLERAVHAFADGNADQAKATAVIAAQVARLRAGALEDLAASAEASPIKDIFAMFVVFSMLERVADQAKNLCEEAVFAATGETKAKKVYRILFLDRGDASLARMAEAIARHNFPNSGQFESAALIGSESDPEMLGFMSARGIEVEESGTAAFDKTPHELVDYHVVVSLQGPIESYVDDTPFHTATLEWDVAKSADDGPIDHEAVYRSLSFQIRELMERLRGPEAD